MPLEIRDFNTMVEAILDRIIAADVGITDKSQGSVIRTIVESIVAEIDMQYYQIGYIHDSIDPDDAVGSDLDRAIAILGVIRNPATTAVGTLTFSRSTPATSNIPIPYGSVISTKKDYNGDIIEVKVTDKTAVLAIGGTSIDVDIETVLPGKVYITEGKLSVMSTPIVGIESVSNSSIIDGGSDLESDDSLRARYKLRLSGLGKATSSALESSIRSIPGVVDVYVIDQARGVATTDISIVCDTMPPQPEMVASISSTILDTKAAGIDVAVTYPTVVTSNISITLTKDAEYDIQEIRNAAGSAILSYFATLGIGDSLIVKQLERYILESSDGILDMATVAPTGNVTSTNMQIRRVGTITIDGTVW